MSLSLAADKRSFHTQTLETADGYQLVAQRYLPSGPVRARLIVAGATGVQQQFYRRFARFARLRGYDTLTLDYRGVGLSAPAELRQVLVQLWRAGGAATARGGLQRQIVSREQLKPRVQHVEPAGRA